VSKSWNGFNCGSSSSAAAAKHSARALRTALYALLLGAALPLAVQAQTAPATAQRLFASGFEGAITIVPPNPGNFWGTGGWTDIIGTDGSTGFTWPPNIWGGGGGRFLFLTNPLGVSAADIGSYMFNRIETVTGPKGNQTRALYQEISRNINGTEPMGTSIATNLFNILPNGETSDLYVSYWVKFQPDLVEKMNNLPPGPGIDNGGTWRSFFAFKTGGQKAFAGPLNDPVNNGDYRLEVYVLTFGGGTPYWQVLADNNAGGGAPLFNSWVVQNRAVPVPVGQWFKFEIFWHRSSGADGRVGRTKRQIERLAHQRLHSNGSAAQEHRLNVQSEFIEKALLGRQPKHIGANRLGADADRKLYFLLSLCSTARKHQIQHRVNR